VDDPDDIDSPDAPLVIISSDGRPPSALIATPVPNYDTYRQKLEPLFELEDRLIRLLSSADEDEPTRLGPSWGSYSAQGSGRENQPPTANGLSTPNLIIPQKPQTTGSIHSGYSRHLFKQKEVVVHNSKDWKKTFALGGNSKSPKSAHTGEIEGWWEDPDDPVHALNACAPAMLELWRDPNVRQRLDEKRIRLEESGGL